MLTRRRFLQAAGGMLGIGAAAGASTRWVEPEWLRISEHSVPIGRGAKLPDRAPLRALQLSDFHASEVVSFEFIERAVRLGLAQNPKVIFLTGDFISARLEDWDHYAQILALLPQHAPTFACLGNHDGGSWIGRNGYRDAAFVRGVLERSGITLLDNAATTLAIGSWHLRIVGVSDLWNKECHPERAFAGPAPAADATILLSHSPDSKDLLRPYPWDVMLCGHTHGGQLRLPLLGTPFAPVRDHRFVEGLHRWEDRWLHITRGVGNLHGLRFNCRPEVSLLMLQ